MTAVDAAIAVSLGIVAFCVSLAFDATVADSLLLAITMVCLSSLVTRSDKRR